MTTGAPKEVLKYLQEDLDSLNTYNTNQIQETPTETLTYKEISQNDDGTWTQNDNIVENPVKLPLDQKRADILDLENKITSFKESAAILDNKILDLNNQINFRYFALRVVAHCIGRNIVFFEQISSNACIFTQYQIHLAEYSNGSQSHIFHIPDWCANYIEFCHKKILAFYFPKI